MSESLQKRTDKQIARQADRKLGAELRDEARTDLLADTTGLDKAQVESWIQLLESEETEPIASLSAGSAALLMLDARRRVIAIREAR